MPVHIYTQIYFIIQCLNLCNFQKKPTILVPSTYVMQELFNPVFLVGKPGLNFCFLDLCISTVTHRFIISELPGSVQIAF